MLQAQKTIFVVTVLSALALSTAFFKPEKSNNASTVVTRKDYIADLDARCKSLRKEGEQVYKTDDSSFFDAEAPAADSKSLVPEIQEKISNFEMKIGLMRKLPRPSRPEDTVDHLWKERDSIVELSNKEMLSYLSSIGVGKDREQQDKTEKKFEQFRIAINNRIDDLTDEAHRYGFSECFILPEVRHTPVPGPPPFPPKPN